MGKRRIFSSLFKKKDGNFGGSGEEGGTTHYTDDDILQDIIDYINSDKFAFQARHRILKSTVNRADYSFNINGVLICVYRNGSISIDHEMLNINKSKGIEVYKLINDEENKNISSSKEDKISSAKKRVKNWRNPDSRMPGAVAADI